MHPALIGADVHLVDRAQAAGVSQNQLPRHDAVDAARPILHHDDAVCGEARARCRGDIWALGEQLKQLRDRHLGEIESVRGLASEALIVVAGARVVVDAGAAKAGLLEAVGHAAGAAEEAQDEGVERGRGEWCAHGSMSR